MGLHKSGKSLHRQCLESETGASMRHETNTKLCEGNQAGVTRALKSINVSCLANAWSKTESVGTVAALVAYRRLHR